MTEEKKHYSNIITSPPPIEQLAEADESIEVGYADHEVAKVLLLKRGEPILIMNRLVFTSEGDAIEYAINIYRADRYKCEIHHRRLKAP